MNNEKPTKKVVKKVVKKPTKPEPADKKGTGGFFSKLFGGSRKEAPAKTPKKVIKKPITPNINKGQQAKPAQEPIKEQVSPLASKRRSEQVKSQGPTKAEPEYDIERSFIGKEDSQSIYGGKRMRQSVFIYAPPSKFLPIQEEINRQYEDVTAVGTSSLADLISVYNTKNDTRNIIVFSDADETTAGLLPFLSVVTNIKISNPEILQISIVFAKSANPEVLRQKSYSKYINMVQLPVEFDRISENHIKQIMAMVIKNQPTYVHEEDKKIEVPKAATAKTKLTVEMPFEVLSIEDLRQKVNEARKMRTAETDAVVEDKIRNTTKETFKDDMDDISTLLPELNVLKEYGERLREYLETAHDNLSPEEVTKLAATQLGLTMVEADTLEQIFNPMVDKILQGVNSEDENVRYRSKSDSQSLEEYSLPDDADVNDEKIQELLAIRNEIRDKTLNGINEYQSNVALLNNTLETHKQLVQQSQLALKDSMESIEDISEPELVEYAALQVSKMEETKLAVNKSKDAIVKKMENTIQYATSVLKDAKVIITIDDILIDFLNSDRELMKTNTTKRVYSVDNPLRARGKIHVLTGIDDLLKYFYLVVQPATLVINTFVNINFKEGTIIHTLDQYALSDHTVRPNIININTEVDNLNYISTIVTKLKYTAQFYNKVVFLIKPEHLPYFEKAFNEVSEVVCVTSTAPDSLRDVNQTLSKIKPIETIYAKSVLVVGYDEAITPKEELRVAMNLTPDIGQFYLPTIEDKEDLKRFIITLRKI